MLSNRLNDSKEDSKLLYSAFEIYTYGKNMAPTSGLSPKLYILSIWKDLGNNKIIGVSAAFIITTSQSKANYKLSLKTIKEIVMADVKEGGVVYVGSRF